MEENRSYSFYAAGKLLLFGEYLVLRNSKSFSIPLSKGQDLQIDYQGNKSNILWLAKEENKEWLQITFSNSLEIVETNRPKEAETAQLLLKIIQKEKPGHIKEGLRLTFNSNFKRQYGWGTSATLISLLAQWSKIEAQYLLKESFGGSGYDVETAIAKKPIIYKKNPLFTMPTSINENVTDKLLFVYLSKKQSSGKEVKRFKNIQTTDRQIEEIDDIINEAVNCENIETFEALMNRSEVLLTKILQKPKVKDLYFGDYPYAIKSLGAWGGDFIMAACRNLEDARNYFDKKGFDVSYSYEEIIRKEE